MFRMEPYSTDKIKRRKRKYYNNEGELYPLVNDRSTIIPFKLAFREFNTIYDGKEKMPFKKRDPNYQAIFRNEFK